MVFNYNVSGFDNDTTRIHSHTQTEELNQKSSADSLINFPVQNILGR